MDELRAAIGDALRAVSSGDASVPARIAALLPGDEAMLAAMPASVPSIGALTTKLVSLFPRNRDRPTHQAVIVAFDPDDGTPIAVMDGTHITEARTAAASALATTLLARPDARTVTIVGTGAQARAHAWALIRVVPEAQITLVGRDAERTRAVAAALSSELGHEVKPHDSLDRALSGADIVCACTHSAEHVVVRSALSPGVHINSVGYNTAGREVDGATVAAAAVYVESRAAALASPPAGSNDLLWPMNDGLIDASSIRGEIGELLAGTVEGRTDDEQITLYKSVGIAAEDAAAAALVLRAARERGGGRVFEL